MKNIIYVIFFSLLSGMLVACSDEKKVSSESGSEIGEKTEKVATTPTTVETKESTAEKKAATTDDDGRLALGEKLVKEHCSSCHQTEMYTRAESKIKSSDALLKQIKMCDSNIGTALFDEDMGAIAAYLEKNFYKFAP